jgi:hypothetical protein
MLKCGALQATGADFPDAGDTLSMDETDADLLEDKPVGRADVKKKARMRSRGSAKRLPTER